MSLEKLKKALEGQDLDFKLEDFNIMPKSDFDTLIDGYKTTIEETKTKSNKIGREEILKELKNDIGLDYEQRKNPENLKKAFIEKFGAPKETDNEDIKALQEKFTKELSDRDAKYDSLVESHKRESDTKSIREALSNQFASYKDKTNYKTEDLVTIALSSNEFTVVDGKVFQSKDGEPIKNDLLQGITPEAFAKNMMQGDYIKKVEGGRVAGDKKEGGKYTMEEFVAAQEAQGVNINGEQFTKNMNDAIKSEVLEV